MEGRDRGKEGERAESRKRQKDAIGEGRGRNGILSPSHNCAPTPKYLIIGVMLEACAMRRAVGGVVTMYC